MKDLSAEQKLALWAIIPVGLANAILTFIFFFIAIGPISYIFGWTLGTSLSVTIAASLGVGFVVGEALIHWFDPDGWEGKITNYIILALLMAINWGAGFYRAQDNITNNRVNAVEQAAEDPRYSSLLEEKQNLERNVLADGKVGNDEMAIARQTAITAELGKIVDEYRSESNGTKSSNTALAILSLAFIAVNIIFGKSVKYLRKQSPKKTATATEETAQPQPKAQPPKPRNVAPVSPPKIATATPGQVQPAFGFHAKPQSDSHPDLSETDREILRLWESGITNKAEIGRKVGKSRTHVGNVVNGNSNVVVRKDTSTTRLSKQERLDVLAEYLEEYPDASLSELASVVGVASRETIRKYLQELDL